MWKTLKEILEIGQKPRRYPPGDGFNPPLDGVPGMPFWKQLLIVVIIIGAAFCWCRMMV